MRSDSSASIPLTQGYRALVDEADYAWLSQWRWCALKVSGKIYAQRRLSRKEGGTLISMHRLIMGFPAGAEIDHRDGDGLNNRRSNLRVVSHANNQMNQQLSRANTSGFKGVYFDKQTSKWKAQIKHSGVRKHLGRFLTPQEAAVAYDVAAKARFGEFANLNFNGGF